MTSNLGRRRPKQRRAQETVEAIQDAVLKILKRSGARAVTTNRIAEVAGVSIGSVYQYFPDKRAIFAALHERHIQAVSRVVESTLVEHATSRPPELVIALLLALIDEHAADPELHELLGSLASAGADGTRGLEVRLRGALRLALASKLEGGALDRAIFVLSNVVESLAHGAVLRRPAGLSLAAARKEAVRAVRGYLDQM